MPGERADGAAQGGATRGVTLWRMPCTAASGCVDASATDGCGCQAGEVRAAVARARGCAAGSNLLHFARCAMRADLSVLES